MEVQISLWESDFNSSGYIPRSKIAELYYMSWDIQQWSKNALIEFVEDQIVVKDFPKFKAGDTITVTYKIVEGQKERLQKFQGIVIKRSGQGKTGTFTIRKISNNIGVERCFPIASPMIENIELNKEGAVRKSRIYYLRGLRGKKAKIKEAKRKVWFQYP